MLEETVIERIAVDNGLTVGALAAEGGLAAGSGLLLGLAFRIPALALLAWVALVPLIVAVRLATPRRAAAWGFVTGVVFFGIFLCWSAIFGAMAIVGLVGYVSLWLALFAAGVWWLSRLGLGWRLAGIPALLVLLEFVRSFGPYGFPWGVLGYSQQPVGPIAQFAFLGGVFGLSAVLALVNACLSELVWAGLERAGLVPLGDAVDASREDAGRVGRGNGSRSDVADVAGAGDRQGHVTVVAAAIAAGAVLLVLGTGLARLATPVRQPTVRVAGVQPSIDQWAKFDVSQAGMVMRTLSNLTQRALRSRPALLIWPETVIPMTTSDETSFVAGAREQTARAGADFLYGSFVILPGGGLSNSALLTTVSGRTSRYGKVHLVPFGEFVPMRPIIGDIGMLRMVQTDQVSAGQPVLLDSSRGPLGTVICFESSDEALVRRVANKGARLLVVITNDGWFERTAASDQHFQVTAMRAIENGIYTVQVSNNGISGVIDPRGRVLARTRLWDRTVMHGRVALGSEMTPYRRFGSWPLALLSLAILVAAAFTGVRSHRPVLKS